MLTELSIFCPRCPRGSLLPVIGHRPAKMFLNAALCDLWSSLGLALRIGVLDNLRAQLGRKLDGTPRVRRASPQLEPARGARSCYFPAQRRSRDRGIYEV